MAKQSIEGQAGVDGALHVELDVRTGLLETLDIGHNRWHPEIPPIAHTSPGESVVLDLRSGVDAQITRDTTLKDFRGFEEGRDHPLTGPLYIEGAESGDLLEVEILEIDPDSFGVTAIGTFGLLADRFNEPYFIKWTIENGVARSGDLPGIAIRGQPFLGVIGVAPSPERLREFAEREAELFQRGANLVQLPDPRNAVPSTGRPATEGLRTVPPREIGGNLDIPQLTAGSKLLLPVDVPGALVSVSDTHFAQGEGEICSNAIEVGARATLRFGLQKSADVEWRPRYPAFERDETTGTSTRRRYLVTTGIPVNSEDRNENLDLNLAARAAVDEMIGYLTTVRGLSPLNAYVLISVAADLRVSEVVNVPNAIVSVHLPLDIFD